MKTKNNQKLPIIKEAIVVEGKTDTTHLKRLFDVQTIETNGSAINKKTMSLIIQASQNNGVILLLDPDSTGELIRKKIAAQLKTYKQAFIKQDKWSTKKIGVCEATDEAIIDAIKSAATYVKENKPNISLTDFDSLPLNNYDNRLKLCNQLKISYCNHKQLYKRVNLLGITFLELKEMCKDYE